MEVIEGDGGCLSVVLAGWPKLRNDLRRPKLEEIGLRTDAFSLDGITGSSVNTFAGCFRPVRNSRKAPMGSSVPRP